MRRSVLRDDRGTVPRIPLRSIQATLADTLYGLCREQAGLPTARDFNDWMQRNGLSLTIAAETLGMTRRMIAHYRTGSRPIPKVVGLACKGWEAERQG